jgi:hypothetical protein
VFKLLARILSKPQKGEVNMAGILLMGIAMVFIAVGFIIYPIILTGVDTILDWTAATTLTHLPGFAAGPPIVPADIDMYTGLAQVAGIVPLLVLVGFLAAAVIEGLMGIKMMKTGTGKVDMGGILLLGIGLIFISVGLIIFPVIMDGVSVAYNSALAGTYTGMNVLAMVPLLCLIAFVSVTVITGFFGIKLQSADAN